MSNKGNKTTFGEVDTLEEEVEESQDEAQEKSSTQDNKAKDEQEQKDQKSDQSQGSQQVSVDREEDQQEGGEQEKEKQESGSKEEQSESNLETLDDLSREEKVSMLKDTGMFDVIKEEVKKEIEAEQSDIDSKTEGPFGVGTKQHRIANVSPTGRAGKTKRKLKKQVENGEVKTVYVPLDLAEKKRGKKAYISVTINGYRFKIQKGIQVRVPRDVADLLNNHIQNEPAQKVSTNLENADEETKKALTRTT